jgi:hypothetical protein
MWVLKPHCIRCCHFKVVDVRALEAASTHCWRQRHSFAALAMLYAMTLVTAWMLWRRNVDLLVPAGTSTHLNWIQCGFNLRRPVQIHMFVGITCTQHWSLCDPRIPRLLNLWCSFFVFQPWHCNKVMCWPVMIHGTGLKAKISHK